MYKNLFEYMEYIYSDMIQNFSSNTKNSNPNPILNRQIISEFRPTVESIEDFIKKLRIHISGNHPICTKQDNECINHSSICSLSCELSKNFEHKFRNYFRSKFHYNIDTLPKVPNGSFCHVNYDGRIGSGYSMDTDKNQKNSDILFIVFEDCSFQRIDYPNPKILSIEKISFFETQEFGKITKLPYMPNLDKLLGV